jgi:radical SAM protein with 4Fe4S-binding SPASM domain
MRYHLSEGFVLKWLEIPSLYDIKKDELYELDDGAFRYLRECTSPEGCDSDDAEREFIDYCLSEGTLTTNPVDIIRSPVISSPVPSLRYLELQITDNCNLRCRHCYIGIPQNRELSIPELKSVLTEFENMQGLRLLITGGEPLMHSHFAEFNALLPEYAYRKILFTNGLLLDQNILGQLNVDEIQFSIDGMENGHEALRGKGTFRKVIKSVEMALGSGMPVSVATMVHRENRSEFDEMERLFQGLGIRDWSVDVPCLEGSFRDNDVLQVSPEIGGKFLDYGFGGGLHGGGEGFGCGLHLAAVLAGGEICKCAFYSGDPAGTIGKGLRDAWKRIKPVNLQNLDCARLSCGVIDECRGGCRYRAAVISGKHKDGIDTDAGVERDLYKCIHYGIIK